MWNMLLITLFSLLIGPAYPLTYTIQGSLVSTCPLNLTLVTTTYNKLVVLSTNLEILCDNIFKDATHLDTLYFDTNSQLAAISAKAFAGMSNLLSVTFIRNAITTLPAGIFIPVGRTLLMFSIELNAALTRVDPEVFADCSALSSVYFKGSYVTLENIPNLSSFSRTLSSFMFYSYNFAGNFPEEYLGQLNALSYLDLSNNDLVDRALANFTAPALRTLRLDSNNIVTVYQDELARYPNLYELRISGNQILDIPDFPELPYLNTLALYSNSIRTVALNAFVNISNLVTLQMQNNYIDSFFINTPLLQLQHLDLSNNRIISLMDFTSDIFNNLQTLRLHSNLLSQLPNISEISETVQYLTVYSYSIKVYILDTAKLVGSNCEPCVSYINNLEISNISQDLLAVLKNINVLIIRGSLTSFPNLTLIAGTLKTLYIYSSSIAEVFYNDISVLKTLNSLSLSTSKLQYFPFEALEGMPSLYFLNLPSNQLTLPDLRWMTQRASTLNINLQYNPFRCDHSICWVAMGLSTNAYVCGTSYCYAIYLELKNNIKFTTTYQPCSQPPALKYTILDKVSSTVIGCDKGPPTSYWKRQGEGPHITTSGYKDLYVSVQQQRLVGARSQVDCATRCASLQSSWLMVECLAFKYGSNGDCLLYI